MSRNTVIYVRHVLLEAGGDDFDFGNSGARGKFRDGHNRFRDVFGLQSVFQHFSGWFHRTPLD